jgi:hypothetical protein
LVNVPLRNEASNDYGKVHGKVSLVFDFFDVTDARKEKRAKAFAEMEHTMA